MRYISFLFIAFVFSTASHAQLAIDFEDISLVEALEKARTNNQLVFLHGCVDWSQPCSAFNEYTLTNGEVGAFYNENFINIHMDMEEFPGVELAEIYDIYGYPALLFFNSKGEVVHRGCGALNEKEMIELGKVALSDENLASLEDRFKSGDRSVDFLTQYSLLLEGACMDKSAFVDEYFRTIRSENKMNEASWTMINLNVDEPYSDEFQFLLKNREEFIQLYGKDTVDQKIHDVLLDQFIAIYEGADVTLFATQALRNMMSDLRFEGKKELESLVNMQYADLKQDWDLYAENVVDVVKEQEVSDPVQLNDFAWKFYLFVDEEQKLDTALDWMKEVVKRNPEATYLDTYASLLFKTGDQKNAIRYAEKALEAAEYELEDITHYNSQLAKFQDGY